MAKKKRRPTKAVRLAVSALLRLSGKPMPRQFEQAVWFRADPSDICRDQPDVQATVVMIRELLAEGELAALVEQAQPAGRWPY